MAAIALFSLTGWSCTLRENDNYRVTGGTKVYVTIFDRPSWQIAGPLYTGFCKQNIVCTSDFIAQEINISGWGAAEFYDGIRDYSDFWPAVQTVADEGWDDFLDVGNACLVLTKSPSGGLHWETRLREHSDCRDGVWLELE